LLVVGRVLELGNEVDERLSQRRHDVGRVVVRQASDNANGELPDLELFVVERNKQAANVLCL
jgi:hypothetical protein